MNRHSYKRDWLPTYTGEKIKTLRPDPEKIHIIDIAHHLSLLSRFCGATSKLCSVAQHSVIVSDMLKYKGCESSTILWGLLHDAAEAYLGDIRMEVKQLLPGFRKLEDHWLKIIITKYNLTWPEPEVVKEMDWIVGNNEALSLYPHGSLEFFNIQDVRRIYLTPWTSEHAEKVFLDRFTTASFRML